MKGLVILACMGAAQWEHPAGMVTDATVAEIREKTESHPWARDLLESRERQLQGWIDVPSAELEEVFPRCCGNVYHNFSCPDDRNRLTFDPFRSQTFTCPQCGQSFPAHTDAGIYAPGDRYHGTMYDGWACIFYQAAGDKAADMGLLGRLRGDERYFRRGIEILMLYDYLP